MADEQDDGYLLSEKAVQKVAKAVKRVLGHPVNPRPALEQRQGFYSPLRAYVNDSSETIPPYAVLAISTVFSSTNNPAPLYRVVKPSSTFRRRYAVNTSVPTTAGGSGMLTFDSPTVILFSTIGGTPAQNDALGPAPGEWGAVKGWPATTIVDGIVSSTNHWLLGSMDKIDSLLGKTGGSSVNTGPSTAYTILAGTVANSTPSGFSPVTAEFTVVVESSIFITIDHRNNGWIAEPLQCNP